MSTQQTTLNDRSSGLGLVEFDWRHPRAQFLGPLLAIVLCVGLANIQQRIYPELPIAVLYLAPVVILVWTTSRVVGFIGAAAVALSRVMIDVLYPHPLSNWSVPYWNFCITLPVYLLAAHLLHRVRVLVEREREMAMTDQLTRLGNRRFFMDLAHVELTRTKRYHRPLALGYLDVDYFKEVNDKMGHAAGDALLRLIADELTGVMRTSDLLSRIGGDEFAVLLPETSPEGAQIAFGKMIERLTEVVRAANFPVSFSVGVVTYVSGPATLEELMAQADATMYAVKREGKNSVLVRPHRIEPFAAVAQAV